MQRERLPGTERASAREGGSAGGPLPAGEEKAPAPGNRETKREAQGQEGPPGGLLHD